MQKTSAGGGVHAVSRVLFYHWREVSRCLLYALLKFDFPCGARRHRFSCRKLSLSPFSFLKIQVSPSTRSCRAGPLLSAPAESRQRQAQGSFTPLRIPGPKWGAGRPPLETHKSSLARSPWPNSSPLRGWSFGAVGESRERVRARHGRRTSTASGLGADAPLAPAFWPTFPSPLRSPKGKVCRSCAKAHGTTSETAFAATPSQISRKLLPRKRLGVPSLPSRGCAEGTLARPPVVESQRGRSPLWPVFAYFLLARK